MPKSKKTDKKTETADPILKELTEFFGVKFKADEPTTLADIEKVNRVKKYGLKFDSRHEINIACVPEKLMEKVGDVLVSQQLLSTYLGSYDFEKWFENFTWEFRKDLPSTKKLPPELIKPYGKDSKHRFGKVNLDSETIFFKPDRTIEKGFLVHGTIPEIKRQLLDYARSPQSEALSVPKGISEAKYLTGHPEIKLLFRQVSELEPGQVAGAKSEVSITLTKYSEYNDGYGLQVLTTGDLKQFANKIEGLFIAPKLFPVYKGSYVQSYQDWRNGYGSWGMFKDEISAVSFYKQIVQIKGDTFNQERLGSGHKKAEKGSKKTVTILGESVEVQRRHREVVLGLWVAYIYMPTTKEKIILASRNPKQLVDYRIS